MTSEPLSLETFSNRVGEPFRLLVGDGTVLDLRLDEATRAGEPHQPGLGFRSR